MVYFSLCYFLLRQLTERTITPKRFSRKLERSMLNIMKVFAANLAATLCLIYTELSLICCTFLDYFSCYSMYDAIQSWRIKS